jgi:hypothetical protein
MISGAIDVFSLSHNFDKGINTSIVMAAWLWKGKAWYCCTMLKFPREINGIGKCNSVNLIELVKRKIYVFH